MAEPAAERAPGRPRPRRSVYRCLGEGRRRVTAGACDCLFGGRRRSAAALVESPMASQQAILISGSPRPRGNTSHALDVVEAVLSEAGYTSERLRLSALDFGSCIACERCRKDKRCTGVIDELTPWYDRLLEADLWVIGSPVYNYNITSWMKAFVDRLYCFYDFGEGHPRPWSARLAGLGKRVITFVLGEQTDREDIGFAPEALTKPLTALGLESLGSFVFTGYFGPDALEEDHERVARFRSNIARAVG